MTPDPEEVVAAVARRISAHYRISVPNAVTNITRALESAPFELGRVEAIYWFTAGWMGGRGRDAIHGFIPAPRDQPRPVK